MCHVVGTGDLGAVSLVDRSGGRGVAGRVGVAWLACLGAGRVGIGRIKPKCLTSSPFSLSYLSLDCAHNGRLLPCRVNPVCPLSFLRQRVTFGVRPIRPGRAPPLGERRTVIISLAGGGVVRACGLATPVGAALISALHKAGEAAIQAQRDMGSAVKSLRGKTRKKSKKKKKERKGGQS